MIMSDQDLHVLANRINQLVNDYNPSSDNASQILLGLRQTARELEQKCATPSELELSFHYQPHQNACVRIAIELGLFDRLDEPTTASDLAGRIEGADPEFALRIVRALCASGVLHEELGPTGETVVRHSLLSQVWRQPGSQAYAKHQWDNMVMSLAAIIPFLRARGLQSPQDPLNSPFAYALGAENIGFFPLLQQYPERLDSFNQGMTGTNLPVVSTYPFSRLAEGNPSAALVDVGGGRGHTSQEILTAYPELKGALVLQDLPTVLEGGAKLQVDPTDVRVQTYDFLKQEQPVHGAIKSCYNIKIKANKSPGAAAYLYKAIFHDWPDASCRQILKNLAPVMRGFNSRLLICDLVVGPLASSQPYKAMRDINMMIMAGKERTVAQWEELLGAERFRIAQIWGINNLGNSIIEARLIE